MSKTLNTTYRRVALPNGVIIHYAEAGPQEAPTLLLLHGYPSSSNQFRRLIPLLSTKYHVVAPDMPTFGLTTVPDSLRSEEVTFDYLANSLELFIDAVELKAFVMYIFDFGAPAGLRLALNRPQQVKGIITQNGNAYLEGLGDAWDPVRQWWTTTKGSDEHRKTVEFLLAEQFTLDRAKWEYEQGEPSDQIDPYSYTIDYHLNLASPEAKQRQLSLFWDYRNNLELYPTFQRYFRESGVPILAVWGRHDQFFLPAGAEAFKKDGSAVRVEILDGRHFLLETHSEEVAAIIHEWLKEVQW